MKENPGDTQKARISLRLTAHAALSAVLSLLAFGVAGANVSLPTIFGDHMVLQGGIAVPIWGTADPGERVAVTAGDDRATATAGADGNWSVKLGKLQPSATPIDVTVSGKNTVTFHDVLVGDVWICSGQSNMQFGIGNDGDAKETIAAANEPLIRLFVVPLVTARTPQTATPAPVNAQMMGSWQICTPESLQKDGSWNGFSAVAYYFGHNISQFTKQPVGLISTNWGGTVAQAWTSLDGLKTSPVLAGYVANALDYQKNFDANEQKYLTVDVPTWQTNFDKWKTDVDTPYQASLKDWQAQCVTAKAASQPLPPKPVEAAAPRHPGDPRGNPNVPTALYNGMIAPLVPYGIKGAIWYQGESNAGQAAQYAALFPAMITDWRSHWGEGDFPFLFVQLANFMGRSASPTDTGWAALRDSQSKTLSLANTGMAVIIDIGNGRNIHPTDKWDVGYRLALAGEHVAYGANIVYSGPTYESMKIDGSKVRLSFNNVGGGLIIGKQPDHYKPTGDEPFSTTALQGFSIAGADNKFAWADATIDGSTVVVSSTSVPNPASVRYGWADNPAANLYNADGLPASPFRTDSLPVGEQLPPPHAPTPAPTAQPTPAVTQAPTVAPASAPPAVK